MGVTFTLRCDRCGYTDHVERSRIPGESNLGNFRIVTKLEVEFLFTHCSWANEREASNYLLCENCQKLYEEVLQKLGDEVNSVITNFFRADRVRGEYWLGNNDYIDSEFFKFQEEEN